MFFITHLQRGTQTIRYLARVRRAGTFNVLPAQAYLMYTPEQWGWSRSDTLTIHSGPGWPSAQRPLPVFSIHTVGSAVSGGPRTVTSLGHNG